MQKAFVDVKMSVGTCILQSNRAHFNQFTVAKVCPLCQLDDETLDHFLLRCRELQLTREPFIRQLVLTLETAVDTSSRRWAGEDVLRVILDASVLSAWFAEVDDDFLDTIFSLTRSLCNALHAKRSALLDCA